MGKNSKRTIHISQISELPTLLEPSEELNLDFAGPLDSHWGTKKISYFALIDFQIFLVQKLFHLLRQKQSSKFFKITYFFTANLTQFK